MCLGVALGAVATVHSPVAQAQAQKEAKISRALGEPFKAAQAAVGKKQFDVALAEMKKAQAIEKRTPFDDYKIDEFLGYIYTQQGDYAKAAGALERMMNSPLQPPEDADERTRVIAKLHY